MSLKTGPTRPGALWYQLEAGFNGGFIRPRPAVSDPLATGRPPGTGESPNHPLPSQADCVLPFSVLALTDVEQVTGESRSVNPRRMLWLAPLTIACSVAIVLTVREVAIRVVHPVSRFLPLTPGPEIIDTTLGCVGAIFVFAMMVDSPDAVRRYHWVAVGVLVLSFIPDVLLATSHEMGGGWPEAVFLMIMHVAVWAICVTLLPSLSMTSDSESSKPDRTLSIL